MLIRTEKFKNFSVIGIDPGLTQCGIASLCVNEGQLVSIDALTLINNKIALKSPFQPEYRTDREIRSDKLRLAFESILHQVQPILVCCESPFYNPSSPSAYGSLTDTVSILRLSTQTYCPDVSFVSYAPQEVKQTFKRAGKLGKETMREALKQDTKLCSLVTCSIDLLDEHSIDAIAVGYRWFLNQADYSV